EAANKVLGTRICVSADVADGADGFRGRPVGDLLLRGKTKPLRAYEPLSEAAFADKATSLYLDAFAKLEAGDAGATPAFASLMGVRADDPLVNFHLKRLLNGGSGAVFDLR